VTEKKEEEDKEAEGDDDEDQPPPEEVKPVKEDDAFYSIKYDSNFTFSQFSFFTITTLFFVGVNCFTRKTPLMQKRVWVCCTSRR